MWRVDFSSCLEDDGQAAERSADANPFLSPPWFRLLAGTTIPEPAQAVWYRARAGAGQSVTLPLVRHARPYPWAPRRITSLSNYYTPIYAPLAAATAVDGAVAAIARHIASERPAWDIVDLEPLDKQGSGFQVLRGGLEEAGFWVRPYFRFGNWYLKLAGRGYEEYRDGLPGRLKSTLSRKGRALERSARHEFQVATSLDDLPWALPAYEAVYRVSWKRPEPLASFMPGLIELAAAEGWLRLGVLYIEGRPAAAQIWLVAGGVASIYKLAYDPAFKQFSPGTLLTAHLLRRAIDTDGVDEVDYLVGDDSYKQDWMSGRRERWGLFALNRATWRGRALMLKEGLAVRLRHRRADNFGED
ncbi:MAG: GNAT family N-acetyltransferase [Gammaproteobacteria bacterium]|nr:GNAT family N-acetyltransferase [Gammaproteobacteria bacterium]